MGITKYITLPTTKQTGLPKWANSLIIVAGIALVGGITYFVLTGINKKKREKDSKTTVDNVGNELNKLINQGGDAGTPSFQPSVYASTANSIAAMLGGCEVPSTELKVVNNVATVVKKPIDWLLLVKAFGVRTLDNCGPMTGDTTYDLPTLLKEQLDAQLISYTLEVNGYKKTFYGSDTVTILQGYLTSKGVTL